MKIAIVGAGPAGLLLAHYLRHRETPYEVDVFERRSDLRKEAWAEVRSFPIALLPRGVNALRNVPGLLEAIEKAAVMVDGSCIHRPGKKDVTLLRSSYMSLGRNALVKVLLDELENIPSTRSESKVLVRFESKITKVDFKNKCLHVANADGQEIISQYDCLVAADGASSSIRRLLADEGRLSYTELPNPDSYKSIYLAKQLQGKDDVLQEGKVHVWYGRNNYRVTGVPQPRSDWLSGIVLFPRGKDPFKGLSNASQVHEFFRSTQLDGVAKMLSDEEAQAMIDRPMSTLLSITTNTLHVDDSVLLIGDCAHATSPALGQGCNAALEDVPVFSKCLDEHGDNWSDALAAFTRKRLQDARAVVELSHYNTPRTPWMRTEVLIRVMLKRILPTWISKFMGKLPVEVMITGEKPYSEALSECRWWIQRIKLSEK